jgi:hypothetical protein
MKTIKKIIVLSMLVSMLMNCTGEKGAIGPQGVAGQQGPKGDKGEAGANGEFPKTQTGTFTIKVNDWKINTVSTADDSYYAIVPVSAVNKNILDKGIVNVWWLSSASTQFPLPVDRNSNRILFAYYLEKGEGRVRIDVYPSTNSIKALKPSVDWSFRWMIN